MAERVCCLYRVSTTKQVDHDELNQADIPVRRKACREFAGKMGWNIVREEQEAGVSGYKVSAGDRDKLQLIKKRAEQGKFDILLVFMFDRLAASISGLDAKVEHHPNHAGFLLVDLQLVDLMFPFIEDPAGGQMVAVGGAASAKSSVPHHLPQGGLGTDRGFLAFSVRLPVADVVGQAVGVGFKPLFALVDAPHADALFHEPLDHKWRFIRLAAKIVNMISGLGIKTRDGNNWHEATVGHILHNIAYMGVLRSGESQSEAFPELQIIDPGTFDLAQKLMAERVNEYNDQRTLPKNTSGQSLLSGNLFCGHCGGRLILTSNATKRRNADGEVVSRRRIRYVCYNKTRHRADCDGQPFFPAST